MATDDTTQNTTVIPDTTTQPSLTVTTDQSDYAPQSTATVTATSATPGATLEFLVTDTNTADGITSGTGTPWTVTDGGEGDLDGIANGIVVTSWSVNEDAANQSFVLTVSDVATSESATTAFTDTPPPPSTVPLPTWFNYGDTHIDLASAEGTATTAAGLIWANEGSTLNVNLSSSGTGLFGTFVQVQSSPTEQGYNTTENTVLDTKNSDQFNHSLKLDSLQAVDANGNAVSTLDDNSYYVFRLDLHQENSSPYLSLDELQFWQSATENLGAGTYTTGNDALGAPTFSFNSGLATKVYDLNSTGDQSVLLNSQFTAGSGGGADLVVLIHTNAFDPSNGNFIYLYSAFGYQGADTTHQSNSDAYQGSWSSNATFEEWGALTKSTGDTGSDPFAVMSLGKDLVCPEGGESVAGGTILAGKPIDWVYTLTNTGNTSIDDITLTDSVLGTIWIDGAFASGISGDFAGDTHNLGVLDADETWTFTVHDVATASITKDPDTGAYIPYSNTAHADGTSTDSNDANPNPSSDSEQVTYFGADPHLGITKTVNGASHVDVFTGQTLNWKVVVDDTGSNIALDNIVVTDGTGTLDSDLDLGLADSSTYTYSTTALSGNHINTAEAKTTFSDDCDNSLLLDKTASADYTGHDVATPGLTKGYWATHLTLWDVVSGDEKGGGTEINVLSKDWNYDGSITKSTVLDKGAASSLGMVSLAKTYDGNNGGGDSGLLINDLNHNGVADDGCNVFFDLASAQTIANTSVSGDARLILASQAVAAQLNEYMDWLNDGAALPTGNSASPAGLLQDAARWLKGDTTYQLSANGHSNVNSSTANDKLGVVAVIDDKFGSDYTISGNAITLKSGAMSSSDDSWSKLVSTGFTYQSHIDGNTYTVTADGEGLKNALAAYNHGLSGTTAGFAVSTDGTLLGWQNADNSITQSPYANTDQSFWGVLEDQNLLFAQSGGTQGMQILGVSHT